MSALHARHYLDSRLRVRPGLWAVSVPAISASDRFGQPAAVVGGRADPDRKWRLPAAQDVYCLCSQRIMPLDGPGLFRFAHPFVMWENAG